jgi:hypothetical protein
MAAARCHPGFNRVRVMRSLKAICVPGIPALAAAFVLVVPPTITSSAAVEISRVAGCDGDVLKLRGDILAGDFAKIRSHFRDQRRIAGLDLDSPGGSLYEGLRIALLTRQKKLSTYVAKGCDSACAFIFMLGRKRYVAKDAQIGVHAVGADFGAEDSGAIRDTIRFARLSAKFGIPSSIIGKLVTTPPRKITILDQADLAALKVIVRDPFAQATAEGDRTCNADAAEQASTRDGPPIARNSSSRDPEVRSGKHASSARPVGRSRTAPQRLPR